MRPPSRLSISWCHVFWHQHHGKFHRIGNALDGRQTRVALAAFNLRQVLHRHARNARDVVIPLQDTHSPL
jgi:hypothetical protein